MKQFEQSKLDVAIKYVVRIAKGCNPVNNVPLENDDILNNTTVSRDEKIEMMGKIEALHTFHSIINRTRRKDASGRLHIIKGSLCYT